MGDEGGERRLGRGGAAAVEEDVEGQGREKSRSLARFFVFSIGDAKSGSSEEMTTTMEGVPTAATTPSVN